MVDHRAADEARDLATLLDVARSVASTLDLEPLLNLILDQLKLVADYSGASIMVLEGEMGRFLESRGASAAEREPELIGLRVRALPSAVWDRLLRRESVIIANVRTDDTPEARSYRATTRRYLDTPAMSYVRAYLGVPLVYRDVVFGVLMLSHREAGFFTERHAELAGAIATHAASAIAHARLYEEAREAQAAGARQIERMNTLTGITAQLLAATELEAVLGVVVESASRLCDASGALVMLIDPDGSVVRPHAVHGALAGLFDLLADGEPLDDAYLSTTAMGQAIGRGSVVVVEDYTMWPGPAERREQARTLGVQSFVIAPLRLDGRPIGLLLVGDPAPRAFAPEDVALVQALADQAALAIEQARLHQQGRERSQELATLLQASRAVSSTLDLEPLLGVTLDQLKLVVEYASAVVITAEEDGFRAREYRGPLPRDLVLSRPVPVPATPAATAALEAGEPVVIADVWGESPEAVIYRANMGEEYLRTTASYLHCLLIAPMVLKGSLTGALVITHPTPGYYTGHHAALVTTVANQAAVAIENARLYEHAHRLAALEERQRLARELHDSVSQSVFSLGMMARAAHTQYMRGSDRLGETLDRIGALSQEALIEMRSLLLELHPAAFNEMGLTRALERLIAGLRLRGNLDVRLEAESARRPPATMEYALFRIGQEALANVAKHSRASCVTVTITERGDTLTVTVSDNGVGFAPEGAVPGAGGGMGLRSMHERAAAAGILLTLHSSIGAGTTVRADAPLGRSAE